MATDQEFDELYNALKDLKYFYDLRADDNYSGDTEKAAAVKAKDLIAQHMQEVYDRRAADAAVEECAAEPEADAYNPEQYPPIVVRMGGEVFSCECGCNVFHRPPDTDGLFKCNECGNVYDGS